MTQKEIYFDTREKTLKKLAYNDSVYAWLLLHSHYNKGERHNYIYKNEFTYKQIAADIHKHRDTVSKRFKALIEDNVIYEFTYKGKIAYKMPYFDDFETLDGPTVLGLITLPVNETREELVKTYAFLLKSRRESYRQDIADNVDHPNGVFRTSAAAVLEVFGHSTGHSQAFDRMRLIFTILQGAGIIEFEQTEFCQRADGTFDPAQLLVYKVYPKASDKWLGIHAK